ncbi:phage holin family protein [Algoriphagus sp. H41]|uniref:Phage holin family protein n=1 Tax=Algoriphagus oliviformis TaxID=2811231 RepID=A0ABS3BZD8_9BACT|nr:phage holin family protein [Algoriphagus oliviformis]MBN7810048.1 phage holin family protein [Algoriphagus oliviformis]
MLKIGEIVQTVKGIIEARIGIVKQEIQDEFVGILSRLILLVVIGSMLMLVFLFLSLSLAFFLSQVTKSPYMGFLIVALLYFLVVLAMIVTRDSLRTQQRVERMLKNFIFKVKLKREQEENEQEIG